MLPRLKLNFNFGNEIQKFSFPLCPTPLLATMSSSLGRNPCPPRTRTLPRPWHLLLTVSLLALPSARAISPKEIEQAKSNGRSYNFSVNGTVHLACDLTVPEVIACKVTGHERARCFPTSNFLDIVPGTVDDRTGICVCDPVYGFTATAGVLPPAALGGGGLYDGAASSPAFCFTAACVSGPGACNGRNWLSWVTVAGCTVIAIGATSLSVFGWYLLLVRKAGRTPGPPPVTASSLKLALAAAAEAAPSSAATGPGGLPARQSSTAMCWTTLASAIRRRNNATFVSLLLCVFATLFLVFWSLFPAIVVATGTHHGWDTFCIGVGVSIFTAAQMASWWTLALMYIQIAEVTKVQQKVGTQLSGKFRTIVIGVSATGAVGTLTFVMIERLDLLMGFALCCMLSTAILNAVGVRRLRKSLRFKSNEPMTRIYRKARLLGILLFFGFAFGVLNAAMIFFRPLGTTYMYHLGVMLSYWAFQIAVALAAAEVVLFVYQLEQGKMPRPDSGAFVLSNPMSSQQGLDLRTIKEEKSRDVSVSSTTSGSGLAAKTSGSSSGGDSGGGNSAASAAYLDLRVFSRGAAKSSSARLRVRVSGAASVLSLRSAGFLRRSVAWCRTEGFTGAAGAFILVVLQVNCFIIVMTHCTPILDELQGRRGIREAIKVTAAVSVAVGIICAIMFLRVTRALILVTCRHRRIHDRMEHRLWGNKQSAWKVGRLWQLIMLQISSGGRWFDLWEFLREFAEAVLQMLALGDYANSGLDRVWLDAYVCVLLVNSFSAIVLALPKALPALFGNQAPETRARRERFVLGLDVICDTFYTTFATVYFVLKLNSFLYGAAGEQLCADMGVQGLPCADAIGLVMAPVAQELHFGGHTFIGILFKFATRLGPLWFAAARAEEVFEVQAVARATRRRMQIPRQKKQLPRRKDKKKKQEMLDGLVGTGIFGNVELSVLDVESGDGAGAASADRRRTSWATQKLSREVDEVGRAIPVLVPRRFVAFFVIVVWSFCIFAWVRIALLDAPCRSDDPWKKYCRMHAHPIVDFNLPGNGKCACTAFAGGLTESSVESDGGNRRPTSCADPRFMEDLRQGMLTESLTARYVQSVAFAKGCVVNTTHVEEIMDGFENLAVFALQLSPAIESLRLPAKSFKKLKMLSVLWLDGIQLDGGIPEEIAELHSSLTVLGLTNTGLTTVNPSLWKCTSLGIFYLSHNRLKELPPGMEKLTLLSVFGADNNRLTQLPNELGTLSHLGSLQVSNNLLTSLPRSFAQLQVLFRLSLSGNRFARVPLFGSLPWIWPQLQFLDLQDNNITVLPPTWQLHRDARVTEELDYQFHANGTWREPFEEPSWTPDRDCENWDKCDGWHVTDPRENDVPPLLIVLLGGNPVAQQQQQPPQLASNPLEQFRRNNLAGTMESDLPAIVVASGNASASCAPGCLDPEWGRLSPNLITFQVDGFCDIVCNTSACGYDGGDCQSKVKPRSGWPNERGDTRTE